MTSPTPLSSEFLSAIIEHLAHPVFVKDRDYRYVLVNQAAFEVIGRTREEMIGHTDFDIFSSEEAAFLRSQDEELFTTGATVKVDEERITDSAGDVHVLMTTKVPRRDAEGNVTHLVGITTDITHIKEAEEHLRDSNTELELRVAERNEELAAAQQELLRKERLAVLGQLAGGLAHQLRNPLAAIQNAVALVGKGALSESQRQALDIIAEEVTRADRTISDLLEYARVRPPEPREVLLQHLVEEAVDLERVPEGIRIVVAIQDDVTVRVDPLQTQLAIGNVVRNAIDAMPQGGTIHLSMEVDESTVRIIIRDDGVGVVEEARAILFEPLVTTKPLGVGLGLSTARNLVENQGGTIRYAPGEVCGSVFVIELPLLHADAAR